MCREIRNFSLVIQCPRPTELSPVLFSPTIAISTHDFVGKLFFVIERLNATHTRSLFHSLTISHSMPRTHDHSFAHSRSPTHWVTITLSLTHNHWLTTTDSRLVTHDHSFTHNRSVQLCIAMQELPEGISWWTMLASTGTLAQYWPGPRYRRTKWKSAWRQVCSHFESRRFLSQLQKQFPAN